MASKSFINKIRSASIRRIKTLKDVIAKGTSKCPAESVR